MIQENKISTTQKMNSRNISLDILKLILAVFVILLHCKVFSEYNEVIYYLSVHGLFRIAVPTFFLINGYFFKNVIKTGQIKKWAIRVLILYVVWMIIYAPFWLSSNINSSIINLLIGYNHLWYIKAMLLCGILLFFIKKMSRKNMLILTSILFSIGVFLQYLVNYHLFEFAFLDKLKEITFIYRNFLFLGLPFFIIGYLISITDLPKRITSKQINYLMFLGAAALFIESYINYYYTKEGIDNLFSLILISPLIFIYTLNSKLKYSINSKNIALISTAMYLVHPLAVKLLNSIHKFDPSFLSLLTIILSFTISLFLLKINSKLKFLL